MNITKTKDMFNGKVPKKVIKIEREVLEEVDAYIYVGQVMNFEKDHDGEINQCLTIGGKAFSRNRDILKSTLLIVKRWFTRRSVG